MEKYLELGQIVNTFGIRGQVKVKPFTDDIKKFDTFKEIFVEKKNQLQLFQIEKVNYSKGMVILKLKGIETPEQAETLRNCYIKMDRKNAKKLPEGTYYIADLIGLDTVKDSLEVLYKDYEDPKFRVCPLIRRKVEMGHCGKKNKKGFYRY